MGDCGGVYGPHMDMGTGYCRISRDDLTRTQVRVGSVPSEPGGSSHRRIHVLGAPCWVLLNRCCACVCSTGLLKSGGKTSTRKTRQAAIHLNGLLLTSQSA